MRSLPIIPALLLFAATGESRAEVLGPNLELGQKASLSLSGFWATTHSEASAKGAFGTLGTRVDFERDLGLSDHGVSVIGDLRYNFNRRNGLELSYFEFNRSGEKSIGRTIDFAGQVFVQPITLSSTYQSQIWRLSYVYAFIDNPRHRATVQVGMHVLHVAASMSRTGAQGSVTGNSASVSTDAPLPVIGMGYGYRISSRWMLEANGQVFRARLDNIDGHLNNLSLLVAYAPLRTLNVFAGYNYYRLDVTITKTGWNGNTILDYRGPWAGFVYGFGGPR
jgi:hypothetical protein